MSVESLEPLGVVTLRPVDVVAGRFEVGPQLFEFLRRVDLDGRMRLATRRRWLNPEMDLSSASVTEPRTSAQRELCRLEDL